MEQEKLGKYTLVSKIADGGMAEVYLAQIGGHGGFAKRVAVKKILPYFTKDDAFVHSFINEARICGQLNHINLVEVFEFAQDGDVYYLAMEFIDGLDLERILDHLRESGRPLPIDIASSLILQVLDGLDYAHTAKGLDGKPLNVIHRDLKPSNVLIDRSGVIKIVDFGIAKASSNLYKTRDLGSAKGTVGYMSPEQAIGSSNLSPSSDVFSIGIIFYELITLKRLFDAKNVFAILESVRTADVDARLRQVAGLPEPLRKVMNKALSKDAAGRYPSAGEMARDLKAITPGGRGHARLSRFIEGLYQEGLVPLYATPGGKSGATTGMGGSSPKTGDFKQDAFAQLAPELGDIDGRSEEKTLPLPAILAPQGAAPRSAVQIRPSTPPPPQARPAPVAPPGGGDPLATYIPGPQDMPQGGTTSDEPTATETDPRQSPRPAPSAFPLPMEPLPPPPPGPGARPEDPTLPSQRLPRAGSEDRTLPAQRLPRAGSEDRTLPAQRLPRPGPEDRTLPAQRLPSRPEAGPRGGDDPREGQRTRRGPPGGPGGARRTFGETGRPGRGASGSGPQKEAGRPRGKGPATPPEEAMTAKGPTAKPRTSEAPKEKAAPPREVGTRRGIILLGSVVGVLAVILGVLFATHREAPRVTLSVLTDPGGAQVYVDERLRIQSTPGSFELSVDGSLDVTLVVKKEGYEDATREHITVQETEESLSFTFQLEPKVATGAVYIETSPPGASIIIDGEDSQKYTPATVSGIAVGQRVITLHKEGFRDETFTFVIDETQQDIARTLER